MWELVKWKMKRWRQSPWLTNLMKILGGRAENASFDQLTHTTSSPIEIQAEKKDRQLLETQTVSQNLSESDWTPWAIFTLSPNLSLRSCSVQKFQNIAAHEMHRKKGASSMGKGAPSCFKSQLITTVLLGSGLLRNREQRGNRTEEGHVLCYLPSTLVYFMEKYSCLGPSCLGP